MIYQIISLHRTGTHLLGEYTNSYDEIFTAGWGIKDNKLYYDKNLDQWPFAQKKSNINLTKAKFDWLEKQKKNNNHYPIIVNNLLYRKNSYRNFIKRLITYYEGYHILTIKRDSWDRFKSYWFQVCTRFQHCHVFKEDTTWKMPVDFKMNMDKESIKEFISDEHAHYRLLKQVLENVTMHTTIEYEDLNTAYLNNFFKNNDKFVKYLPMNIEYEQYIVDVEYWKKYYERLNNSYVTKLATS